MLITEQIILLIITKKKGELTIYRNGQSLGLIYSSLSGELFPAIDFYTNGCSVELTKFKGKKIVI